MIGGTDKRKLFAAAAMCVLIAAVSVTGGLLLEKRQQYVPEVEIIKAEPVTSVAVVSENVTAAASETVLKNISERSVSVSEKMSRLVNINTASAAELEQLNGIGEKTAAAIIEYRQETPFEKIEDIKNVKGIGDKKFEDIKNMICV